MKFMEEKNPIPQMLSFLLLTHVILLSLVGIPLLMAPKGYMELFGWEAVDPTLSRASSAGFIAIAAISSELRKCTLVDINPYLGVLLLWDGITSISLFVSMIEHEDSVTWFNISVSIITGVYAIVWLYFKGIAQKLANQAREGSIL